MDIPTFYPNRFSVLERITEAICGKTMREIIKEPNSLLHQKCEPVTNFDEARQIGDELLIVMKSVSKWWNRWLGFAANQIGYNKRIIGLRKGKDRYEILINPILVEKKFPFLY